MGGEGITFEYVPKGPFDLSNQNQYFGGWPTLEGDPAAIVMAFPVEGWQGSAALVLKQSPDGRITGKVHGPAALADRARRQALACLSLDVPAEGWPEVGARDPVIGRLQEKYRYLRPVLFHSPYEAAAGFVIGHRISMKQKQALVRRMAEELGEPFRVEGEIFHAFPAPPALLTIPAYKGLSGQKAERLRGIARAALEGVLDRDSLRSLPIADAITRLESLAGIGPFFAQGILHRGAGLTDEITRDETTAYAVKAAYGLEQTPDHAGILEIARPWRPFRMWAAVLLHVWIRREVGLPRRRGH
jgi:DNA-3-methyladenine glycosylase II